MRCSRAIRPGSGTAEKPRGCDKRALSRHRVLGISQRGLDALKADGLTKYLKKGQAFETSGWRKPKAAR